MELKVFVSVGTPANEDQRTFRDAVLGSIRLSGLSPRLMEDKDWDYKNPLRGVRRVMEECAGAVVIAFERYRFESGLELRDPEPRNLKQVSFPTAWNQIEAAMAYERDFPILVIAQRGLVEQAVLETTQDLKPIWTELDPSFAQSDKFLGILRSWKEDIKIRAAAGQRAEIELAAHKQSVGKLIASLPVGQLWALLTALIGALAAIATVAYKLGAGNLP